jgi:hypothetical protein
MRLATREECVYNIAYMAKKKKHHKKSRNSRKQRAQASAVSSVSAIEPKGTSVTAANTASKVDKTTTVTAKKPDITYDDVELSYVRSDVLHTLVLVGIILAVYLVLWLLMAYTHLGTQLTQLLGR